MSSRRVEGWSGTLRVPATGTRNPENRSQSREDVRDQWRSRLVHRDTPPRKVRVYYPLRFHVSQTLFWPAKSLGVRCRCKRTRRVYNDVFLSSNGGIVSYVHLHPVPTRSRRVLSSRMSGDPSPVVKTRTDGDDTSDTKEPRLPFRLFSQGGTQYIEKLIST